MSHSYLDECPNCSKQANFCNENKPFENTSIQCPYCGLVTDMNIRYLDLEDLNDLREHLGMRPLKRLPKQEFEY